LDVGTGSGCIAITLACERKDAVLYAVDISEAALTLAHTNAQNFGVADRVSFIRNDLLLNLDFTVDALVANLPYIKISEIADLSKNVRDYEPFLALDGGPDGFQLIERLIGQASDFMPAGAHIFLETGYDQASRTASLLELYNFTDIEITRDLSGIPRIISGKR
ncbi:MAG: peptide chain release factor N(5)-glutamine methyltransferase, partial [Lentisphaerae bacterium]|nr:peptide chain release factor N(5)-glutamine methyltransferase [Lentisphaerota bacterium]